MATLREMLIGITVVLLTFTFLGTLLTEESVLASPRIINFRIRTLGKSTATTAKGPDLLVPTFIGLPNSSFRSPYHRYWETNCSLIFEQDKATIDATTELIKRARGNTPLLPPDSLFVEFTRNCPEFKRLRQYPTRPLSEEEREFPVAYILVIHKEVAQVERLFRAIYQPQNIYCMHPDAKSPPAFLEAVRNLASCFDNVFISSKIESVQYAGYTRLQADLNCMEDLLQKPVQWKYALNLCGQDFPLKTNLEIIRQLKAGLNHNFVHSIPITPYKRQRVMYHYETAGKASPEKTKTKKAPPPSNFTIHVGNAYYAVTRDFVDYVLHDQRAISLLKWSEDTYSPDEHFWATLQSYPGVPGGFQNAHTMRRDFRFVKWGSSGKCPECVGQYVRGVCVFGMGYLAHLVKQPLTFANKFSYNQDPVAIQCLEEMLEYRQRYPQTVHRFVTNFPITQSNWSDVDYYCPP